MLDVISFLEKYFRIMQYLDKLNKSIIAYLLFPVSFLNKKELRSWLGSWLGFF